MYGEGGEVDKFAEVDSHWMLFVAPATGKRTGMAGAEDYSWCRCDRCRDCGGGRGGGEDAGYVRRDVGVAPAAVNGVLELGASNVANKCFGVDGFDYGKALDGTFDQNLLDFLYIKARSRYRGDMAGHNLRYRNAKAVVFLVVKERKSVEPNHSICYPAFAETITDSLRYSNYDL